MGIVEAIARGMLYLFLGLAVALCGFMVVSFMLEGVCFLFKLAFALL